MSCKPGCPVCEQLRAAALNVVGAGGGLDAVTLEALEDEAGFAHGEAQRHYSTPRACLYETYESVSDSLLDEYKGAFATEQGWDSAFTTARRQLLARLAARPAEAYLCFVETLGADRELRQRREHKRRWLIDFLDRQLASSGGAGPSSRLQLELLVGATFHEMSTTVASGRASELPDLEPRLADLARMFDPAWRASVPARSSPGLVAAMTPGSARAT
jgi:AcrR family transcriptional regulator